MGDIEKGETGAEKNRRKAEEGWFSFSVHSRINLASEKLALLLWASMITLHFENRMSPTGSCLSAPVQLQLHMEWGNQQRHPTSESPLFLVSVHSFKINPILGRPLE